MDALSDWERVCVTAGDCPRIVPQFLEEEKRSLGELRFRQEYCCEFLEDGRAVFPSAWIDAAFNPWSRANERRIGARFAIGVDLGQLTNPTAIAVMETREELTGQLNRVSWEQARQRRTAVRSLQRVPLGTTYVDVVDTFFLSLANGNNSAPASSSSRPPVSAAQSSTCSTSLLETLPPPPRRLHLRRTRDFQHRPLAGPRRSPGIRRPPPRTPKHPLGHLPSGSDLFSGRPGRLVVRGHEAVKKSWGHSGLVS